MLSKNLFSLVDYYKMFCEYDLNNLDLSNHKYVFYKEIIY